MHRWLIFVFAPALLFGQTTPATSSISGHFVAPGGHPLHGYLYLTGESLGAVSQKVFSGADDGSFHFNSLPAGVYSICSRSTMDQAPSIEEPFLDSCAWPSFAQSVRLKPGQALMDVKVQAQPGVRLHVRVNTGPLTTLAPLLNPHAVDPDLELHVRGADQLTHVLPALTSGPTGRDHAVVIPHDTYVVLRSKSKTLSVSDLTGKKVAPEQQIFVKSGVLPTKITLQVAKLP